MKEGKKYILRESELKEIIKEMILDEISEANDGSAYFVSTDGYTPQTIPHIRDYVSTGGKVLKSGLSAILKAFGVNDEYIERVQNGDNDLAQWLIGALGLNTAGHVGADYVPDVRSMKWAGGPGWGKGNNFDAKEVFYPDQAARWILSNATPRYIRGKNGWCARYVKLALNAGGLSAPWGMIAGSAKDYLKVLPSNGWVEIPPSQAGQVGDVMVIDACRTRSGRRGFHKYGHIAMYCGGGQWVSDFRHRPDNIYGLNGTPPASAVHYFRYKNIAQ